VKVVNSTPVPVRLDLGELDGTTVKYGMLVAKATFTLNVDGLPELETQQPLPILDRDEDGELGLLPRDTLPRRDSAFEVIVVGAAYAPRPTAASWIELRVGPYHKRLRVSGDREWVEAASGPAITSAVPFQRLDLGWHRAFGGSCKVMLDADTPFEFKDPLNPDGRGFDPEKLALDYGKALRAPTGYPKLIGHRRWLPNLEDPEHLIHRPSDAPPPACWSTVPATAGFLYRSAIDRAQVAGEETLAEHLSRYYHRAHPDWVLPCPSEGSPVELFGMTPDRPLQFRMPRTRVLADYEVGSRAGTRELEPHLMMLLPEKRQLYIVYRHFFTLQATPAEQRSFRIRLAEGWFVGAPKRMEKAAS
jgi:hypothetical protein